MDNNNHWLKLLTSPKASYMSILKLMTSYASCKFIIIVIPPNTNAFSNWRRMHHVLWVKTQQLPGANKTLKLPRETTTWTWSGHAPWNRGSFVSQLHESKRFLHSFFQFWVGRYNKTLNFWSSGQQWVLFPLNLRERKLPVSSGDSY